MSDFIFGSFDDNDPSLQTVSGGKFGLNHGFFSLIQFNPNGGAGGSAMNCVDIHVKVSDREFRRRIFDITGIILKDGNNEIQPTDEKYPEIFAKNMKQITACVVHAIKAAGVKQEDIDKMFKIAPATSFVDWTERIISLLPANYTTIPIDVFLHWQNSIQSGQNTTYLELPKNMKSGRWLESAVKPVGTWSEQITADGLKYTDDAGNEHPFQRSEFYMNSNNAKRITTGDTSVVNSITQPGSAEDAAEQVWS